MKRLLVLAIASTLAGACAAPNPGDVHRGEATQRKTDHAAVPVAREAPGERARNQASAAANAADALGQALPAPESREAATLAIATPAVPQSMPAGLPAQYREIASRERYAEHVANRVQLAAENPLSTFSIDVDTGSFSNVRRLLEQGQLPPAGAVRTEEFINWFDYGYTPPATIDTPFSVTSELAVAPWDAQRRLLLVGLKGFEVPAARVPAANLVFLVDTSGSMQSEDKLGLLKQSLSLLAERLRPQDRVAIVAYAGSAGVVLPPTAGSERERILAALDRLEAGGSTNGAAGIELAYQLAQAQYVEDGVNRVILATDGDFNVGTVSLEALEALVKARRESGVALTTLGFGRDNYNDELAERLADLGNGNHAYIDRLEEGRKVLVDELGSTLLTIAADVKIQIEFNPATVAEYRLIGYENRLLAREDFNNDRVDAGEIGAGHDVTALYELSLVGSGGGRIDPLRYAAAATSTAAGDEIGLLKLRYKPRAGAASRLIEQPIRNAPAADLSDRLQLAAAVAGFAELLRGDGALAGFDWTTLQRLLEHEPRTLPAAQLATLREMVQRARSLQDGSTLSYAE